MASVGLGRGSSGRSTTGKPCRRASSMSPSHTSVLVVAPTPAPNFDAVVSIPSATSTVVADFARSLAAQLCVPWIELRKTRMTDPQKRFRSKQRKERNIRGAFALPQQVRLDRVLLIDDVLDSGASLRAASEMLRPARVYPLLLARTKHRDDI